MTEMTEIWRPLHVNDDWQPSGVSPRTKGRPSDGARLGRSAQPRAVTGAVPCSGCGVGALLVVTGQTVQIQSALSRLYQYNPAYLEENTRRYAL